MAQIIRLSKLNQIIPNKTTAGRVWEPAVSASKAHGYAQRQLGQAASELRELGRLQGFWSEPGRPQGRNGDYWSELGGPRGEVPFRKESRRKTKRRKTILHPGSAIHNLRKLVRFEWRVMKQKIPVPPRVAAIPWSFEKTRPVPWNKRDGTGQLNVLAWGETYTIWYTGSSIRTAKKY